MSRLPRAGETGGEALIATGAILAGLGVAAGAFGAHLLKARLETEDLDTWRTAASYQMYHALALIVMARLYARHPTRLLRVACGLFVTGILIFSGSLYLLALTGEPLLGAFAPLGGLAFLGAWGCLAAGIIRNSHH